MSISFRRTACVATAILSLLGLQGNAAAQATDPYLGQIMCGAFNFPPKGWARLDGQILSIAQNIPLFALLGTNYGGNGQTTFALPDMRGRVLIHDGSGPGLTPRTLGEEGGVEALSLTTAQLPAHNHTVIPMGSTADATQVSPAQGVPPTKARTTLYAPGPGTVAMSSTLTTTTGGSQPVPVMQPYLVINCFIAVQGAFPPRN